MPEQAKRCRAHEIVEGRTGHRLANNASEGIGWALGDIDCSGTALANAE